MFNLACLRQVKKLEIMNLQNFNLVELNYQESSLVDGGGPIKKIGLAYFVSEIIDDWEEIKAGWREGWADGGNK